MTAPERKAREATQRPGAEATAFLNRLAVALNRTNAYPPEHPVLASAMEELAADVAELTVHVAEVSIGVARDRLLVGVEETEVSNGLHRGLAQRLHRKHVRALRIRRGVQPEELASLLAWLNTTREETQDGPSCSTFPNIVVTTVSAGDLALAATDPGEAVGDVWRTIAEAVLSDAVAGGGAGAGGIDVLRRRVETAGGRAEVAAGFTRLAARAAGAAEGATEAGEALGALIAGLDGHLVAAVLEGMSEGETKTRFLADAVQGVPIDSVVPLLTAAAQASDETISHAMLRLLTKLASKADGNVRPAIDADAALRETVHSLVGDWSLADPNPAAYRDLLTRLTRTEVEAGAGRSLEDPAERLFMVGLETGVGSAAVWSSLDSLLEQGRIDVVMAAIGDADGDVSFRERCRERITGSPHFADFVAGERASADVVLRIAEWTGSMVAAEPLLEALETADNAATRRRLLSTLEKLGPSIAPLLVVRLKGRPWYVRRNMLVLLGAMERLPPDFSALPFLSDADARVRREAVKIAVRAGADRAPALARGLSDSSELVLVAALLGLKNEMPASLVPEVLEIAERTDLARETRSLAIRAVARRGDEMVLSWLLCQAGRRRWPFRMKLAARTDILPTVLIELRQRWPDVPEVKRLLLLAARSGDAELRATAQGIGA